MVNLKTETFLNIFNNLYLEMNFLIAFFTVSPEINLES